MLSPWYTGARANGSFTLPNLFPDYSDQDAPAGTMALRGHLTILSDLTQEQVFESGNDILHASPLDTPNLTLHYWITTRSILPTFTQDWQDSGYNIIYFTPFSSEAAWTRICPKNPISNMISVWRTETTPPTLPSLGSSMSTSPKPETPPSHNSPSKPIFDPTTALIALMQQPQQQKAAMMVHIHSRPPPPSAPKLPPSHPYKPQRPPFPKCDGTLPTTPPIPITSRYIQGRGLLRRCPLLDTNYNDKQASKHCNQLQYACISPPICILDVSQRRQISVRWDWHAFFVDHSP